MVMDCEDIDHRLYSSYHYQNLALIHDYPDYIFNFEGAVKYNWMKEYYPLDYEKVKEAIKTGDGMYPVLLGMPMM